MSPVDGPRDDPTLGPGEEQGRASRPPFESFSSEGRQRDLLPLPHVDVPRAPSGLSLSRGTRQRSSRAGYLARGVNEAVSAINDLYGGTRNPPSSATPAQLEVLEDIRGRLQRVPVPEARPSPQEAARELLGLGLAYTGEETGMHIGKYDRDLVALPSVKEPPPNVREVLDPEALDIVVNFQQKMLLAPDEWESLSRSTARIVPYTDVVLAKGGSVYWQFVEDLFKSHVVGFTQQPMDSLAPFFVWKKNGALRFIGDARRPNQRFRQPPSCPIGGSACWSRARVPPNMTLHVASADAEVYFFRCGIDEALGRYFCMQAVPSWLVNRLDPSLAGKGIDGRPWYPFFKVLPMGFTWSFWIAQRIHVELARRATGLPLSRIIVEGRPWPDLSSGEPVLMPYCDNSHTIGTDPAVVQATQDKITATFRAHGFPMHEEVPALPQCKSLGVLVDGEAGTVRPTPERLHKVVEALRYVSRRPRLTGKELERLVSHATFIMLLNRPLLSVFSSVYVYIRKRYTARARVWGSVARECRHAAALLPLAESPLRTPVSTSVLSYDSSGKGMCVTAAELSHDEVLEASRWDERWRFKVKAGQRVAPREEALRTLDPLVDLESVKSPLEAPLPPHIELDRSFPDISGSILARDRWTVRYTHLAAERAHPHYRGASLRGGRPARLSGSPNFRVAASASG